MSLYKSIAWLEISLIVAFILFYGLYLLNTAGKARKFNTHSFNTLKKLLLRTSYFSLIIIALLGPSFGEVKKEIKAVGKDIYLAVEAFFQCPLTYEQNALGLFIETLNSELVPNAGTNLEAPLQLALDKHLDPNNSTTSKQSKVIVVVSDGEDFEGNIQDISEKISDNGIKVFTLGVGTSEGSKIPYGNSFKTDRNGQVVISKLNDNSLKKLAAITDGKYFELNDEINEVEKMINEISVIEGELRDTRNIDASANKYYYFLFAALLLICIDVLFTTRTFSI